MKKRTIILAISLATVAALVGYGYTVLKREPVVVITRTIGCTDVDGLMETRSDLKHALDSKKCVVREKGTEGVLQIRLNELIGCVKFSDHDKCLLVFRNHMSAQ